MRATVNKELMLGATLAYLFKAQSRNEDGRACVS